MLEIRSILAPTDFSEHMRPALRYAAGLAARFAATLHLLHVLPDIVPMGADPLMSPTLPPDYYTQTEAESLETLKTILDPSWGEVPRIEASVRWGDAVDGVVAYATEHAIDLVVVTTHGRTGLSHALLGSMAERILRESPCPVLSVRDASA